MSDIVEELLAQLDQANAQLRAKEEFIEKLQSDSAGAAPSSKLFHGIAKALKLKNTTVLQTSSADSIKIEFPHIEHPQMPTFTSQPSIRTQFREELKALQPCIKQRADLQAEYERKQTALREDLAKKEAELTESYQRAKALCDTEIKTFLQPMQATVSGALLSEAGSLAVYVVDGIDVDSNFHSDQQLTLRKLTDASGIALSGEKVDKRDLQNIGNIYLLSTQEAAGFYDSLSADTHTLRIQYQLVDIGEDEKACCPYHFAPDTVNMEDVSAT